MHEVFVKASHRIELAGDWSDLPEYYLRYGGRVINIAVDVPGLVIEVQASRISDPRIELISIDRNCTESFQSILDLAPTSPQSDPLFLVKAVLRFWDGAVLQRFLQEGGGIRLVTRSTAPAGSGLGTSSILGAALLLALSRLAGRPLNATQACWQTFEMERANDLGNGWQDQVGGMLAGIKDITCTPNDRLTIRKIDPPASFVDQFARLTVLAFTNQTRFSGIVLNQVNDLIRSDPGTVKILDALKSMAAPVEQAALAGQYGEIGGYFREMTVLQRRLHPAIVPDFLLDLFQRTENLCYGARICGAGGNGFLVFFTRGDAEKAALIQLLKGLGYRSYACTAGTGATFPGHFSTLIHG